MQSVCFCPVAQSSCVQTALDTQPRGQLSNAQGAFQGDLSTVHRKAESRADSGTPVSSLPSPGTSTARPGGLEASVAVKDGRLPPGRGGGWVAAGSAGAARAARLLVLVQQRHAGEGAGAPRALVLLHVRVRLQVGTQVGAVGEGAAAVGAGEGLLTWRGQRQAGARPFPRGRPTPHPRGPWPPAVASFRRGLPVGPEQCPAPL